MFGDLQTMQSGTTRCQTMQPNDAFNSKIVALAETQRGHTTNASTVCLLMQLYRIFIAGAPYLFGALLMVVCVGVAFTIDRRSERGLSEDGILMQGETTLPMP